MNGIAVLLLFTALFMAVAMWDVKPQENHNHHTAVEGDAAQQSAGEQSMLLNAFRKRNNGTV